MGTWAVILAVGLGSYVLRAMPLLLGPRWPRSQRFDNIVAHAGTAALAALIVGGLRRSATSTDELVATGAAVAAALTIAVRGGSMARVLLAGGAAFAVMTGALLLLH